MCSSRWLALLAVSLTACANTEPQGDAGEVIAFASDFESYESWQPSFSFDASAAPPNPDAGCTTPHNSSVPREVYVKSAPPPDSPAFPVGTMIVKEARVSADPATWQVYAMVKRDESFDPGSGCVGWEWFELSDSNGASPAEPQIVWRGVGPSGASYLGCPACASCHANAQNDCVWSVPLASF